MTETEQKINGRLEAAEILTTGWCPNNCRYCYIPKSEAMKELHQQIIRDLKNGSYIENLKKVYGDNLKVLGFWGTEPALTLSIIGSKLPEIFKAFPKLEKISFSTSMIFVEPIRKFIAALSDYNVELGLQISIDGPDFITDKNRFPGAALKVSENTLKLLSSIQKEKTKVVFRWKATLTIDNLKYFNENPSKIDEYYEFFENLESKFEEINKNENIRIEKGSYIPTMAVPGKYTAEDGKILARFLKQLRQKGYKSAYTVRMERLLAYWKDIGTKKTMFTCSGGDSNFGFSKNINICHRGFYFDEKEYVDSVLRENKMDNWDISHFERGTVDMLKNKYIVSPDNQKEITRFLYVMRNYHDFWRLHMGYIRAMLIELALAGQIDKRYLEDEQLSTFFGLFAGSALSCPMENLLNTGSVHLTPVSLLRLFCNGAFREILIQSAEPAFQQQPSLKTAVIKEPRIYFYNWNVGSGIEAIGNSIAGMFTEYRKKHPEKFCEYKMQNPPSILIKELAKFKPDIIIINDYFPRIIEASYYYKLVNKDTRIILLNHCYGNLLNLPEPKKDEYPDRRVAINYALQKKEGIDYILNFNYHPSEEPYPYPLGLKVRDMYFPLSDNIWNCRTPFSKRKKDFLYLGNLHPNKFSEEFIKKISNTNLRVDVYGEFRGEEKYKQSILESKNLNFMGYYPHEKVPELFNQYKFLIIPHKGRECFAPAGIVFLEAIKTGLIPLVVKNESDTKGGVDRAAWARGLYYEFDSVDALLKKMSLLRKEKDKKEYEKMSKKISSVAKKHLNYENFKEKLFELIFPQV